ncbi:MAG: ABC transporter substrate-binding protein [Gaiellaceae bacterium]
MKILIAAAVAVTVTATAGAAILKSQAGTLVFAGAADPTYLDPALVSDGESFRVTEQMYEGLVRLKPGTLKVVPGLATSWSVGKDGKTYTFKLRKGVKFHDGTAFNAKAVCANFNRWYNWTGPFQNAGATYYYQAAFRGFRKNESSTLSKPLYRSCAAKGSSAIVKLTQKSGTFLNWLVLQAFAMQSPTAMKKYGADQGELRSGAFKATGTYAFSHPTGTGPYKFVSWTVGQKVELAKNPRYWGPKAKLDRIVIRPIAANTARLQALQTGEVNAYDLAAPQDVPSIESNNSLKVIKRPAFNVAYVTINSARPPFNNKLVRQAVAHGLDREAVVKQFYFGTGRVAHGFLPPGLFGYTNKVQKYPYNPERAKALLRQAGLTLPVKVEFWYPTGVTRPYMPDPKRNFEAFAASLENSGFNVEVRSAPWRPDYVARVNSGTAGDLNLIGWTGDFGDPDNFVGTFFKTFSPQFGWRNNQIQTLIQKAEVETNLKKRTAMYTKVSILLSKSVPAVPYAHATPALGAQKRVLNLIATPVGGVWFGGTSVGGQ